MVLFGLANKIAANTNIDEIKVIPHQIIMTLSMVLEEEEIFQEEVPVVIGSNLP